MKQFNLCFFLLFCATTAFSQSRIGAWTDYLSYTAAKQVIRAKDKIYCVTEGGLFTYGQSDNSIQKFNQINGLSDIKPNTIAYSEEEDVVLVAYENSNLDLVYKNNVFNLSDIKRKQIQGDKKIYRILIVGKTAYLSCGFGIVAVNLEKREIKDTYYIGYQGSQVVVFDMTFDGNQLFAATAEGIFTADINNQSLQDFNSWTKVASIPHASQKFSEIESYSGSIIAVYDGGDNHQEMYRKNGDSWEPFLSEISSVKGILASGARLSVSMGYLVVVYNPNGDQVDRAESYYTVGDQVYALNARQAYPEDGVLWIADGNNGLIKIRPAPMNWLIRRDPSTIGSFPWWPKAMTCGWHRAGAPMYGTMFLYNHRHSDTARASGRNSVIGIILK